MYLKGGMDTENVIYLHNRKLLSYQKHWIHDILRQMGGTGKYHSKWGITITKEHTWHAFTDKGILSQKLGIPKIQFTYQMIAKKKENQSMVSLVLLRRGNKVPTEGHTEPRCGAESEGKTIPRLPQIVDYPIYSYKTRHYYWCPQVLADWSWIYLSTGRRC